MITYYIYIILLQRHHMNYNYYLSRKRDHWEYLIFQYGKIALCVLRTTVQISRENIDYRWSYDHFYELKYMIRFLKKFNLIAPNAIFYKYKFMIDIEHRKLKKNRFQLLCPVVSFPGASHKTWYNYIVFTGSATGYMFVLKQIN